MIKFCSSFILKIFVTRSWNQKHNGIKTIVEKRRSDENLEKVHSIVCCVWNLNIKNKIIVSKIFEISWKQTYLNALLLPLYLSHSLLRVCNVGSTIPWYPKGVLRISSKNNPVIKHIINAFDELKNMLIDKKNIPGKYKNKPQLANLLLTIVIKLIRIKQIRSIKHAFNKSLLTVPNYFWFQNCNFVHLINFWIEYHFASLKQPFFLTF